MLYVAVDIGCIECGESSAVLGIFLDKKTAEAVCDEHAKRQAANWHGAHYFKVFEVEKLNEVQRVKY